jgi:hypothetical protein
MSTELVQIQSAEVPPLRQSTEQMMSCPLFYVTAVIKGKRQPGGVESALGIQVHRTLAQYAAWCAHKGVAMDLDAFDRFAKGAGPVAAKILNGMRESYSVDHAHVLATELGMSLDENFDPTDASPVVEGESGDSGLPPAFQGTLDSLLVFREEQRIEVDDAKSHPRAFDPADTLQGEMYALLCFKHFPWATKVKFRLVFVRYRNLTRQVEYTRDDVPKLIETVKAARARQRMIHEDYEAGREVEAIPGAHCVYCPLLSNRTCPISEFNPQMQLTPEDRLRFHLWYSAFSAVNNKALKEHIQGTGRNVVLKDYNGKAYVYGPVEKESAVFPLFRKIENGIATDAQGNPDMPIVSLLMDYAHATPEDTAWMGNLVISSTKLNSYLGTKRRAFLDQACHDSADKVTKATLKVSKPLDSIPDEEPETDGEEWDEGEEF